MLRAARRAPSGIGIADSQYNVQVSLIQESGERIYSPRRQHDIVEPVDVEVEAGLREPKLLEEHTTHLVVLPQCTATSPTHELQQPRRQGVI